MAAILNLKGFKDYIGEEAKLRFRVKAIMAETFVKHGFEPVESPSLEYQELLLGKYGAEADKLVYKFEDNGGRKVALRYDQTVPTTRIITQHQSKLVMPYRRFQIQQVWRAEKPQKGRYREFVQCDTDIFGAPEGIADAEVLNVFYSVFVQLGLGDIILKVNDRRQLMQTLKDAGVTEDKIFTAIQTVDKLDKKTQEEVENELLEKGFTRPMVSTMFSAFEKASPSEMLQSIMQSAQSLGVPATSMQFTPTLARGLDYYTGFIFEGIVPGYPVGSLGGGGRYDNLINDLIGTPMAAVGFGIGFDRAIEAIEELNSLQETTAPKTYCVTVFDPASQSYALSIAHTLRAASAHVEVYTRPGDSLGKQLQYISRKGFAYAVIAGEQEAKDKTVIIKEMETGEQKTVPFDQLTPIL